MASTSPMFSLGSDLQWPATKFAASLGTPSRLLKLAPTSEGHPGNAAALNPAIVLTTLAAFEGFAEEFLATVLALQGQGLAQIAREVGNWNNPTLKDWTERVRKLVSPGAVPLLDVGPSKKIVVNHQTSGGNWSARGKDWNDILEDSVAWMQVRHLLTHGLATGWRAEVWAPPLQKQVPPAVSVLRPKTVGKSSLDRAAAKSCARIYSIGARHVASVVAGDLGISLDWSQLPEFV
jgi:hypothetical protein